VGRKREGALRKLVMLFVAVAALGALVVAATSAQAAFEWLCNGKTVGSERCLVVSENLEVLVLEDMSIPAAVECAVGSVLDEGWVGPGNEDETTFVEFMIPATNCKPAAKALDLNNEELANACEKVKNVEAVNLPWLTLVEELTTEGSVDSYWDLIEENGKGQPGYLVECTVAGLNVDDICLTEAASTALVLLLNLPAEGSEPALVSVYFLENPLMANEAATCSVKKEKESGLVKGEVLLEAIEGGKAVSLEVNG
jgi:hypothetical protein